VQHDEILAVKSREVEEAKAKHVELLLLRHKTELAGVQNYFENITLDNLELMKTLKKSIEDAHGTETVAHFRRLKLENRRIMGPLRALEAGALRLREQLQAHHEEKKELNAVKRQLAAAEKDYQHELFHIEVKTQEVDVARREVLQTFQAHEFRRAHQSQQEGLHKMLLETPTRM
jgi:uncharacterized protein (DUF3084 family)